MSKEQLNKTYWQSRWQNTQTGWDIGYASPPLANYIDQLTDKKADILIPGCGNAYEAEHLLSNGFSNVKVLDISPEPLEMLQQRIPSLKPEQLICSDFFHHNGNYDLILEQTFFCAIDPVLRKNYVKHAANLLKPKGKLVGLLWSVAMNNTHPPFGGNKEEYLALFEPYFSIRVMENAYNSITPRADRELFIILEKKS